MRFCNINPLKHPGERPLTPGSFNALSEAGGGVDAGDPTKPYKTDDAKLNQLYTDDAQENEYRYGD